MLKALNTLGHTEFKGDQQKIIECILNRSDVLAILPTGFGKSVLYQVPAIMSPDRICVVISPLIALINDQIQFLKSKSVSSCKWSYGTDLSPYNIVFVTPESFHNFRKFCNKPINFFAIDECHCINKWGIDFRPSYRTMGIRAYFPDTPILAITATATKTTAADIISVLQLSDPMRFTASFDRPEISYSTCFIKPTVHVLEKLREFLKKTKGCGIIYCRRRASVEVYAKQLRMAAYHAGMPQEARDEAYKRWMSGESRVIVATVAFGMGISKPDVRFVIHTSPPASLDEFYQESGRAGRDHKPAVSMMFYSAGNLKKLKSDAKTPEEAVLADHVCNFCKSTNKRLYLMNYFDN